MWQMHKNYWSHAYFPLSSSSSSSPLHGRQYISMYKIRVENVFLCHSPLSIITGLQLCHFLNFPSHFFLPSYYPGHFMALYCSIWGIVLTVIFFSSSSSPSSYIGWKIMVNLHENGWKMIDNRAHQSIITIKIYWEWQLQQQKKRRKTIGTWISSDFFLFFFLLSKRDRKERTTFISFWSKFSTMTTFGLMTWRV